MLQQKIDALTGPQHLVTQRIATQYRVGADGRALWAKTTMTARAMHDFVDSYWFLHAFTEQGSSQQVEGVNDCGVARRLSIHDQLEAVELIFPVQLEISQTHEFAFLVTYSYDDDPGQEDDEPGFYARAFREPLADATLAITFEVAPRMLSRRQWNLKDITPEKGVEVDRLESGTRADCIDLSAPRPGAYGWSWRR